MHFHDLEHCSYGNVTTTSKGWKAPLLSVGWLEHGHPFTTGTTEKSLLDRIKLFQIQSEKRLAMFNYRGQHICSICGSNSQPIDSSHVNLYIPGDECIYIASGGIAHYIEAHFYQPPQSFISSLFNCPLPSSSEYDDALITANSGVVPDLLKSFDELYPDLAKLRRTNKDTSQTS